MATCNPSKSEPHASSLCQVSTKLCANVVEWCPNKDYYNFLLCGTYELYENPNLSQIDSGAAQTRFGSLELYRVTNNSEALLSVNLDLVSSYDGSGILDVKWFSPYSTLFCAVNSLGQASLYHIQSDNSCYLKLVSKLQVCEKSDGSQLCLSCDWLKNSTDNLIVSDSLGCLSLIQFNGTCSMDVLTSWTAHEYECWITAADYQYPHLIYSGSDDCTFKCWDIRTDCTAANAYCFRTKHHESGVCAIQKHLIRESLVATGSFDSRILFWDIRNTKNPIYETLLDNTEIWRLKWHPTNSNLLLAGCMSSGAAILDYSSTNDLPFVTWYKEHFSLVYGVDWIRYPTTSNNLISLVSNSGSNQLDVLTDAFQSMGVCSEEHSLEAVSEKYNDNHIIASCSFYDKSVHIWSA